jgi:hypothetical protein
LKNPYGGYLMPKHINTQGPSRQSKKAWAACQIAVAQEFSVTNNKLINQGNGHVMNPEIACRSFCALVKGGFAFPYFFVLDTIARYFFLPIREPPALEEKYEANNNRETLFARRYYRGMKRLAETFHLAVPISQNQQVGFSNTFAKSAAMIVPLAARFLGWQSLLIPPPTEVVIDEDELFFEILEMARMPTSELGSNIIPEQERGLFMEALIKNGLSTNADDSPDLRKEFINSVALRASLWIAGIKPKEVSDVALRTTTLADYGVASLYLANAQHSPAFDLAQTLTPPPPEEAILPTPSKNYRSFDTIDTFGEIIAPSDLMLLSDPITENYFWSKYAEGSLLKIDTSTPREEPIDVYINFVVPPVVEMRTERRADNDLCFESYAKYLTLLILHDFVYLAVATGCTRNCRFNFSLFLNRPCRGTGSDAVWQEERYRLDPDIQESRVVFNRGFMLDLPWKRLTGKNATDEEEGVPTTDLFYTAPLEDYVHCDGISHTLGNDAKGDYWLIFAPEPITQGRAEPKREQWRTILKSGKGKYRHCITVGYDRCAVFDLVVGSTEVQTLETIAHSQIWARHAGQWPKTVRAEYMIRSQLIDYFVNNLLLPLM